MTRRIASTPHAPSTTIQEGKNLISPYRTVYHYNSPISFIGKGAVGRGAAYLAQRGGGSQRTQHRFSEKAL